MIPISLLIPHRNAVDSLAVQLFRLRAVGPRLSDRPFEVLVLDDCSEESEFARLRELVAKHDGLVRVIRLTEPAGISAALTAGLAAATGDQIVVLQAGDRYPVEAIGDLLAGLSRADLVVARPQRTGWRKWWHRVARIPRWLLLGLEVRDPDCLCWGARREAVAGLELARGMFRYLATFVAARGFRVSEVPVVAKEPGPATRAGLADGWPNPGDLLAAWWLAKRWPRCSTEELPAVAAESTQWKQSA